MTETCEPATGSDAARKAALDEELTRLHGAADQAARLSELHEAAAAMLKGDGNACRFHLTHAWVYALVDGDGARIDALEDRLAALGGL